jgi:hypothetical protein
LHDLLIVPFLIHNRTRTYAIFVVFFFHTVNLMLFNIAIFPWLSVALSILFFPPDFPRQVWHWMQRRWPVLQGLRRGGMGEQSEAESQRALSYAPVVQKRIATLIVVFCLIQLLIPLRHHLFVGDVAWTETGHRYLWRMMLRNKTGYGSFTIVLPATGARIKVNPSRYLTKTQHRKLYGHPDMILQFAHFLRDEYLKKGYKDVEVYAHIRVRLNGRLYRTYVDQTRDLAKVTWHPLKSPDWLMPFDHR